MAEILDSEFLPIDIENLQNIQMPKSKFQTGLSEGAFYAGIASALLNVGLDNDNTTEIIKKLIENRVVFNAKS